MSDFWVVRNDELFEGPYPEDVAYARYVLLQSAAMDAADGFEFDDFQVRRPSYGPA